MLDQYSQNLLTSASSWLVLLAFTALSVQTLRRKFFHHFSAIPGPWMNSISEIPAAYHLVRGEQHLYYQSLHDKYGPVVRVSPNELSFTSVEAREEIYGHRKAGLMEKSPIFLGAVGAVDGQTGVSLALNEDHARQRRALGYMFTNSALLQHEEILDLHIRKLFSVFDTAANNDQPLNLSNWYTYLAFDIMGDLCFAQPLGCLDNGAVTEWASSIIEVFVAATWTQAIRRLAGVGTTLESLAMRLLIPAKAAAHRHTHLNNSKQAAARRLATPRPAHTDFTAQILASAASKQLTPTETTLNMALFMSAGTDTTATALTAWTYFLCTNRAAYARAAAEVRAALPGPASAAAPPSWRHVRTLRFLDASLHEALRLMPPSAASQQRVVPAGGAVIEGVHLPAGATAAVPPWAAARAARNFAEPERFAPERWLGEGRFAGDRLAASAPFGGGPRVCVGRQLAGMEMRVVAAGLLCRFEVELVGGDLNAAWGLDGRLRPPKVFHSMTRPELWVRFRKLES